MAEKKKTQTAEAERPLERVRALGQLRDGLDEAERLMAEGKADVVIDLSACTDITVEGLEWLEEILLRSESFATTIHLENIPPPIYKVFKVARIDAILKACGAPAAALGPNC